MNDRILDVGALTLKLLGALNWLFVIAFAASLVLSFPFAGTVIDLLSAKYRGQDVTPILTAIRGMFVLGIAAGAAAWVIFLQLLAMIDTVRRGDPFVVANAGRLQAIGWALLVIQLLDLALGALTGWFALRGVDHGGWSPSLGGWISVLMVFVLARVFTIGARMRDDLEGTV